MELIVDRCLSSVLANPFGDDQHLSSQLTNGKGNEWFNRQELRIPSTSLVLGWRLLCGNTGIDGDSARDELLVQSFLQGFRLHLRS